MAKKPLEPDYRPAELSPDQIKRAIPRIERRIADLKALDFSRMQQRGGAEVQGIKVAVEQTLEEIFGPHSTEYRRYSPAAILNGGPITISPHGHNDLRFREYYDRSRQSSISLLQQAIQGLEERQADLESIQGVGGTVVAAAEPEEQPFSQRVFVVHGREGEHREAVARFLQQLGLEAVILHEQPNKGRALIAKFNEVAADIGFAVVLMTPDDIGGLRDSGQQQTRARQNVIFELGFFIGALGPDRVAALVSNEVERPSDFDGVVYIPIETDWRLPLCRELRAAGYDIDLNKVL
jgi:predicted nucleotide-binding protein